MNGSGFRTALTGGYRTRLTGGGFPAALSAELIKARRSKVPLMTALAASAPAGIAALFMFILSDPGRARRLGLLGQKAELSGITADWAGLLSFLVQVVAVGDLLLFAFITTWVFGREFGHGTLRYLLALPVPRGTVALAKFAVVGAWGTAVNAWLIGLVLLTGWAMRLPGGTAAVVAGGLADAAVAAALMLLVTAPVVAWVACLARGYLAPLAGALTALIVAQLGAALGFSAVIPWAVPAVAGGVVPDTSLGVAGLVVAVTTGAIGVAGTLYWWRGGHPA